MENPNSWSDLEKVIHEALKEADRMRLARKIGLSTPRIVADAIRAAGLVIDPHVCDRCGNCSQCSECTP